MFEFYLFTCNNCYLYLLCFLFLDTASSWPRHSHQYYSGYQLCATSAAVILLLILLNNNSLELLHNLKT